MMFAEIDNVLTFIVLEGHAARPGQQVSYQSGLIEMVIHS